MRGRGETRERSPWVKATKLGPDHPVTTLHPLLRTLCMQGEKALSMKAKRGQEPVAHFGSPPDPENWVAWRTDAISIFLFGDVPATVEMALGDAADVVVTVGWSDNDG